MPKCQCRLERWYQRRVSEDETLTDPPNEAAPLLTLGRSVSFSLCHLRECRLPPDISFINGSIQCLSAGVILDL